VTRHIRILRLGALATACVIALSALCASQPASASDAPTPHLDGVEATLRRHSPNFEGKVWNRTAGNALDGNVDAGDWILQTPDCWGQSGCEHPTGQARWLDALRHDLARAEHVVDITTLEPFADGEFASTVIAGLRDGYDAGRRPLIRFLGGMGPVIRILYPTAARYRDQIASAVGPDVRLVVARSRPDFFSSIVHTKIVAVDGRTLITGGHNMWAKNYLTRIDPVHDLSVHLSGPVAVDGHRMADVEWSFVCPHASMWFFVEYAATRGVAACPAQAAPAMPESNGSDGFDVLSVGRPGYGVDIGTPGGDPDPVPAHPEDGRCLPFWWNRFNEVAGYPPTEPADVALRALADSATRSITMSQQDIMGYCPATPKYDVRLFDILARKMIAGVDVRLVTSTPGANWDFVNQYSNVTHLSATSTELLRRMARITGDLEASRRILCEHLQLAHLRPGPFENWANGHKFANHAKLLVVDDAVFYAGSDNLYPASIPEWGVMIENPAALASLQEHYLAPLWTWSKATAIVDAEQGRCAP